MNTSTLRFRDEILEGIPHKLPSKKPYDNTVNHAPKRKDILNSAEKQLALKNSLRYFEPEHHKELINGGFGMVIDGSKAAEQRLNSMLFWDVNNGVARGSWARNEGALEAIKRAMEKEPNLKVTLPNEVDDNLLI